MDSHSAMKPCSRAPVTLLTRIIKFQDAQPGVLKERRIRVSCEVI